MALRSSWWQSTWLSPSAGIKAAHSCLRLPCWLARAALLAQVIHAGSRASTTTGLLTGFLPPASAPPALQHYLPTLLALRGLEEGCACEAWAGGAFMQWKGGPHPTTFL